MTGAARRGACDRHVRDAVGLHELMSRRVARDPGLAHPEGRETLHLPVQTPTKYELVINLRTAKAFDLQLPLSVQQCADEVIE